jgi:hypothetical protein
MAEIYSETTETVHLSHGLRIVGTEIVAVVNDKKKVCRGVLLVAARENTSPVYCGLGHVSIEGEDSGMPLHPGDSLEIPCDDASQLFLIATDIDQKVYWMAI